MSTAPYVRIEPPALDFDKSMLESWGEKVSVQGKLERRIAANLCGYLIHHGWRPVETFDGDSFEAATDIKQVMESLFNVESISARFTNGTAIHGVELIAGNGIDIVSDYSYSELDDFRTIMEGFEPEDYA
jgi:hypothetical protein